MNNGLYLSGVEDGPFGAFSRDEVTYANLCYVEMLNNSIENVIISRIKVDGMDATEKLLKMIINKEIRAIFLGGITFGGFNIIDPFIIYHKSNVPVVMCSKEKPDNKSMLSALKKHFDDWDTRWKIIEKLGNVNAVVSKPGAPPIYFEVVGESVDWATEVIRSSTIFSRMPEPIRVARLIARGASQVC